MNERVKKLKESLNVKINPLCIEKARLTTESYKETEDEPVIIRRAKAQAKILDNISIFIEDGELIVGNAASKPMGVEADFWYDAWSQEEIDGLRAECSWGISEEDEAKIRAMSQYWKGKTIAARMAQIFDDEKLWPFAQAGFLVPSWQGKEKWRGGWARGGLSFGPLSGVILDYEKVLNYGLNKVVEEAEDELRNVKFTSANSVEKADFLKAVIIAHKAIIRFANRFAALAEEMASKGSAPVRKKELERIAATCRWVPANPARNFYEAIQAYWFIFLTVGGVLLTSLGRFDQFMYPFYKKDITEGSISDNEVLELLECLRIKCMQIIITSSKSSQEVRAGMAKWQNMVIGGQKADGKDATNELTYLILEAAKDCQTPHHTITLRVHDGTPEALMLKALEVVKTGVGLPAFVGDKSEIQYLLSQGVPLGTARDYALVGCLEASIPGQSRFLTGLMFVVSLVLDIFMHNGVEPRTGRQIGPRTGELEGFESFDDLMIAFKEQLAYFMALLGQYDNVFIKAYGELFPSPDASALMVDGIKAGKDIYNRAMQFENGAVTIPVGMINVADSMAAIKKLVFDEKRVTMKELKAALAANWQGNGYDEMRRMFLAAPKYGNDDDDADSIAKELYQFWADTTAKIDGAYGVKHKPGAISITAQWPGGAITGATPDGRYAGEVLADGTMSPAQGRDTRGPTAVIKSASRIDQALYQSTLMNMKFHPSALQTTDDLRKLSDLIRIYFSLGGKHIQFNVIDRETLIDAQSHPEDYRNLVVRVAGYSAYFVQLSKTIQDDVIMRMEHRMA